MSNRPLDRLGLDDRVCANLSRHGIMTCRDILFTSPLSLMIFADIGLDEVKQVVAQVSEKVRPKCQTANEILAKHKNGTSSRFLSTGLPELDTKMKGGLLFGCINEIVGPPGVGKTQFCLSCCVQMLAVHCRSVIYIDTELKFDAARLMEMAVEKHPQQFSPDHVDNASQRVHEMLGSVQLKRPLNCKDLQNEIDSLQTSVIEHGVSLIVIDSIAALVRKDALDERDKETFFLKQSSTLKRLAERCNAVVLVTNQVTAVIGDMTKSLRGGDGENDRVRTGLGDVYAETIFDTWGRYQPTLGPTWHHCVSIRLTLRHGKKIQPSYELGHQQLYNRTTSSYHDQADSTVIELSSSRGSNGGTERLISITKSPVASPQTVSFLIGLSGLEQC